MQSTGIIRYSPDLLGNHEGHNWWIVLDCDPGIGKYYRWLYHINSFRTNKLSRPAWKEHITVVRDETPLHKEYWERYENEVVEFEYGPEVRWNGLYYWLDVESKRFQAIRDELGLGLPIIGFHLTIGNRKEQC